MKLNTRRKKYNEKKEQRTQIRKKEQNRETLYINIGHWALELCTAQQQLTARY